MTEFFRTVNHNVWSGITENGQTFLAPAQYRNRDRSGISSFQHWEQAFSIYSDIYTRPHPDRAAELIQYNHIISTAAATYLLDNVYYYDCHFRIHMSRNPNRSWAIILQQAWSMFLKDRPKFHESSGRNDKKLCKDICYRFNKGRCTYGANCKFDHRCNICNKFGHGAHICRRAQDKPNSYDRKPDYKDFSKDRKPDKDDHKPPGCIVSLKS